MTGTIADSTIGEILDGKIFRALCPGQTCISASLITKHCKIDSTMPIKVFPNFQIGGFTSPKTICDSDFNPFYSKAVLADYGSLVNNLTSSDKTVATIKNGLVHIVGPGKTVIQMKDPCGGSSSVGIEVINTPEIKFLSIPSKRIGDTDFDPGATTSDGSMYIIPVQILQLQLL